MDKFKVSIVDSTMKDICESTTSQKTRNTNRNIRIYALYFEGELKKIGRAVTGDGVYTRMIQYYNLSPEGINEITPTNMDLIKVKYFNLTTRRDCWAAEKFLQAEAHYSFERMPWDQEVSEE